jgi:hypothetical protein
MSAQQQFYSAQIKMIQLQTMRLHSMNALQLSARINVLLTNEEAECGAVTADDLGKCLSVADKFRGGGRRWVSLKFEMDCWWSLNYKILYATKTHIIKYCSSTTLLASPLIVGGRCGHIVASGHQHHQHI